LTKLKNKFLLISLKKIITSAALQPFRTWS